MKAKITFDEITFGNIWRDPKYIRREEFFIIGIRRKYVAYNLFSWSFHLLGLSISIWFNRIKTT